MNIAKDKTIFRTKIKEFLLLLINFKTVVQSM